MCISFLNPIFPRYIMLEQKKAEDFGITEDDVSEIRQDINKFRFELLEILRKNKFDIGKIRSVGGCYRGKRAKQMERRIMKGFTLEIYDLLKDSLDKQNRNTSVDIFQVMAEAMHKSKTNQINFGNNSDYSPATVAAATKFKRFLGKHLRNANEGERSSGDNNNIKCGSHTAPCSPNRQTELTKLTESDLANSKIELSVSINNSDGSANFPEENQSHSSSAKLRKKYRCSKNSGGWI